MYSILATRNTPQLIIYLLDISASMEDPLGQRRRIDVVTNALTKALQKMIFRSTKGTAIAPRYRIAMLAYSDTVYDLLGGVKPISEIVKLGVPELKPLRWTNTSLAFTAAEKILKREIPSMGDCPAPLLCHVTDGEYNGDDPEPVAKRIMEMGVPDGSVLIENIFISDTVLKTPINDASSWSGITAGTELMDGYAQALRRMSSPIPETYRLMMQEEKYQLSKGAFMLLPGNSPDLVAMGFQMSGSTAIAKG